MRELLVACVRPSRTIHSDVLGCPNSRASCQCSGLDPEQTSKPTAPASPKLDHVRGPSVETTLILPDATLSKLLQGEAFPAKKSAAKSLSPSIYRRSSRLNGEQVTWRILVSYNFIISGL